MESNVCLGCRFGSVKIDISVPEKYNLKGFVKETQEFAAEIVAVTRQKPIHYALIFNPQQSSAINFKVNCSCMLNVKKNDCSNFNPHEDCRITHLQQGRLTPRGVGIEVIKTI